MKLQSNDLFRRAAGALTLGLSLTVCSAGMATSKVPDLNGVWQVTNPVVQLKTVDGKAPPLLPESQKVYDERIAKLKAGKAREYDPSLQSCKPLGEPRMGYESKDFPFEIQQGEDRLMFGYQWNRMVRFVDVKNEFGDVAGPTYMSTSIAKWDGNTLVVTSKEINDITLLDASGMPHSEDLELTERFTLKDNGNTLEERITFKDPKTFSKAWDTVVSYKKLPGARIAEDLCLERLNITLRSPEGVR